MEPGERLVGREVSHEALTEYFHLWASSPQDDLAFDDMVCCAADLWIEAMRGYLLEPSNPNHKEKVVYIARLYNYLKGPWELIPRVRGISRRSEYAGRLLAVAQEMGPVLQEEVAAIRGAAS
jgi:hypothetical protein